MSLRGKVVVMTGASSGIGRAASIRFAARGARVVLAARHREQLEDVALECRAAGGEALVCPTDVTDEAEVQGLVNLALEQTGSIDVWVNNAGVTLFGSLEETPMAEHRRVIETNLFGAIYGARAVVSVFRRQQRGVLINVGSILSKIGHLAGSIAEVSAAEAAVHAGAIAGRPFTLLVQPTLFDPSRAPPDAHTAWAYCHVPHGSTWDACAAIEAHIERFAPGFRRLIRARCQKNACDMQRFNRNYIGGDINGGLADLGQLLFRPVTRVDPYATALEDVFLCSSSTPPGGGVHGMCGYWAAQSVLRKRFRDLQPASLRDARNGLTADRDVVVPDRANAARAI